MDTSSLEYRLACEARYCLTLDREARQRYYALILKHRGQESVNQLLDAVRTEFQKASAPQSSES